MSAAPGRSRGCDSNNEARGGGWHRGLSWFVCLVETPRGGG